MRIRLAGAILSAVLYLGFVGIGDVAIAKSQRLTEAQKAAGRKRFHIDANRDEPLRAVRLPPEGKCVPDHRNGFPVPDPNCTPGAINPTLTLEVLSNPKFTTKFVRDEADGSKATDKAKTYDWYGIKHPTNNTGENQVCELDHFISLEIGGADTLDNIWPQCGPSGVALMERYFKQKDAVEDYLAWLVTHNSMDLKLAQRCIAHDWTQFLENAKKYCPGTRCPKSAPDFSIAECQQ